MCWFTKMQHQMVTLMSGINKLDVKSKMYNFLSELKASRSWEALPVAHVRSPGGSAHQLEFGSSCRRTGAHLPWKATMAVFLHASIFPLFKPHSVCTWFSWHLEWHALSVIHSVNAYFPGRSVCPFFAVNTASIACVTYNPLLANDFLFLDHFCLTGRTCFEGSCI